MVKVMAKVGRKSSKKGASSKKKKSDSEGNPPKVSAEELPQEECESETTTTTTAQEDDGATAAEEEEVRSVLRVLRVIPESEQSTMECSVEGCEKKAVVEWTSNLTPEETQGSCESCQPSELANAAVANDAAMETEANDDAEANDEAKAPQETEDMVVDEDDSSRSCDNDARAAQVSTEEEQASGSPDADAPEGPSTESSNDEASKKEANNDEPSIDPSVEGTPLPAEQELVMEETPSSPSSEKAIDELASPIDANEDEAPIVHTPKKQRIDNEFTTGAGVDASGSKSNSNDGQDVDVDVDMVDGEAAEGADDGEEPAWDLIKIISEESFTKDPIKCGTEDCQRPACVLYASSTDSKDQPERWYGCLDCQDTEFGGWPETPPEFPVTYLTAQHKRAMIRHCSDNPDVEMPTIDEAPPSGMTQPETSSSNNNTRALTPVPPSHQARGGKGKGKSLVTPSPHPLSTSKKPPKAAVKKQLNKRMLEVHQQWQKDAEAVGGKGAKICVDKAEAKQMIFDFSYDSFQPMTITEIYKVRKEVALIFSLLLDEWLDHQPCSFLSSLLFCVCLCVNRD